MDDRIQTVLDIYHRRIATEQAEPRLPRDERLLAVGPETGQLINILARSLAAPTILEIGTSFGYSGIWLAEAARASGGHVISMELDPGKSAYARDMAEKAGLADHIDYRVGDAVSMIADLDTTIDFVLLDLWKDLYVPCLDAFYPRLNSGAIIVADNMIHPAGEDVKIYRRAVRAQPGITSVTLPVGTGIEISRYTPADPLSGYDHEA